MWRGPQGTQARRGSVHPEGPGPLPTDSGLPLVLAQRRGAVFVVLPESSSRLVPHPRRGAENWKNRADYLCLTFQGGLGQDLWTEAVAALLSPPQPGCGEVLPGLCRAVLASVAQSGAGRREYLCVQLGHWLLQRGPFLKTQLPGPGCPACLESISPGCRGPGPPDSGHTPAQPSLLLHLLLALTPRGAVGEEGLAMAAPGPHLVS